MEAFLGKKKKKEQVLDRDPQNHGTSQSCDANS